MDFIKKYIALGLMLFFAQQSFAQTYESQFIKYMMDEYIYGNAEADFERLESASDSIRSFIAKNPDSYLRSNAFQYLLKIEVTLKKPKSEIKQVMDSVLYYDKLPQTKLDIAEDLVDYYSDYEAAEKLLNQGMQDLYVKDHAFRAYFLKARIEGEKGNINEAILNIENALKVDSTKYVGWRELLMLYNASENTTKANMVIGKIQEMENNDLLEYEEGSKQGKNVNNDWSSIAFIPKNGEIPIRPVKKGKYSVINRFDVYCGPCIIEFSALGELIEEYPEVNFTFITVWNTKEQVERFIERKPEFRWLKDQNLIIGVEEIVPNIISTSVPHTFLIDKNGIVQREFIGYEEYFREELVISFKEVFGNHGE